MRSGISYIGIEVPPYVVSAEVIAHKEGVVKEKITDGLLVNEFRFPGESDTIITLAANNLLKFAENVVRNNLLYEQYKKNRIRAIYFATESSSENSRPGSMAVLELVEPILYERMRNAEEGSREKEVYEMLLEDFRKSDSFEAKFACTALAKLIDLANTKIYAGSFDGAIVIGSDVAIYDSSKAKNAEPTQGAASSLVYLTKDPLIAEINKNTAYYNFPAYDFYKPDEHTPRVPTGYGSEVDYVLTIGSALEDFEKSYQMPSSYYLVTHVPFPKEAYYLASFLYTHRLRKNNMIEELETEIGEREPLGEHKNAIALIKGAVRRYNESGSSKEVIEYIAEDEEIKRLWEYHKKVRKTEGFKRFVKEIGIDKAIKIPSQIGNSYNNSVIVAISSLFLNAEEYKPIILASYGSGSGSTILELSPIVSREEAKKLIDISSLERRVELNEEEYIKLHERLIEETEYRRGIEAVRRGRTFTENDRDLLGSKFSEYGFKLVRINENGIGEYTYNGKKVNGRPIVI